MEQGRGAAYSLLLRCGPGRAAGTSGEPVGRLTARTPGLQDQNLHFTAPQGCESLSSIESPSGACNRPGQV